MRAVVLREFGPAGNLVVADVPDLEPGPEQQVIDVEIANITFIETQIRAGWAPNPAMAPTLPAVLGNGVGGTIAGTGQRVVSSTGGVGGYAQRALVHESWPVTVPDDLPLDQAVAVLADGRTALALIEAAKLEPRRDRACRGRRRGSGQPARSACPRQGRPRYRGGGRAG